MEIPAEYLTNEELVDELMRRDSFAGLVFMVEGDARNVEDVSVSDLKLVGRRFSPQQALEVMEEVIEGLNNGETFE